METFVFTEMLIKIERNLIEELKNNEFKTIKAGEGFAIIAIPDLEKSLKALGIKSEIKKEVCKDSHGYQEIWRRKEK